MINADRPINTDRNRERLDVFADGSFAQISEAPSVAAAVKIDGVGNPVESVPLTPALRGNLRKIKAGVFDLVKGDVVTRATLEQRQRLRGRRDKL